MRILALCLGAGILVASACGSSGSNGLSGSTGGVVASAGGSADSLGGSATSPGGSTAGLGGSIGTTSTGGGRSSVTGKCTGSTSCPGETAYDQCLQAACDSQLKATLGNGYASGSFSGPCGPYTTCQQACSCDAAGSTCDTNCYKTYVVGNASCLTAFQAVETCFTGSACTAPACATGTDTSTATSASTATFTNTATITSTATGSSTATTNCAALASCCEVLVAGAQGAAYQQTCSQLTSYGDAACLQVLSGWKQAGLCK